MRSNQIQQKFDDAVGQVLVGENVVVERHGTPWVVVITFQRYQQLLERERELLRRQLQRASVAASERAAHLSETEVDTLIEQARSEVHEEQQSV